jgi:hypothetical protein
MLLVKGKKTDDQDVVIQFGSGQIVAAAKKSQAPLATAAYSALSGATYVHARDPKWDTTFASPPADLDVGGMLRTAKHWLVLQTKEDYVILRLDDANWRAVLQTVTARTGVAINTPKTADN